ncbi:MAG TPA: response regulator [Crinalium sp.]|jgi:PleD family two-component response regulator
MPPINQQRSQPTILIVDDERNVRLMLGRALTNEGYQVVEASTGDACLAVCYQQLPDLILLDAVMPGMDGMNCCAELQQIWGDRCPAILIITALADPQSVDRAFEAGATDFVTKPIHWAVLRQRVKRILQTRSLMAELRQAQEQIEQLTQQLELHPEKLPGTLDTGCL